MYKRTGRTSYLVLSQLIAAVFLISGATQATDVGAHFVYVSETGGTLTDVIHPLLDDRPNAIFHVTQNWNPPGTPGTYNDHVIGVQFSDGLGWWAVYNQDAGGELLGAGFNIWVPPVGASSFVHTATGWDITDNWTVIDNPVTNANPYAIVHVTQNWNPGGGSGVYNDHNIGVFYSSAVSAWAVFNQDLATMPVGVSFNVSIPADDAATFVHTAAAWNISGNCTVFHHPLTDGNPDAIVRVTQNWNPGPVPGVYNDHQIGVWYTGSEWSIFHQDLAPMPVGASFNVTVVDPPFFIDGFESGNTSAWSAVVP